MNFDSRGVGGREAKRIFYVINSNWKNIFCEKNAQVGVNCSFKAFWELRVCNAHAHTHTHVCMAYV